MEEGNLHLGRITLEDQDQGESERRDNEEDCTVLRMQGTWTELPKRQQERI